MSNATKIHLLTQYLWPDDAPTGIYAEHVADALTLAGRDAVLVGGRGRYRAGQRRAPASPVTRIDHYEGRRGDLWLTLREYLSVTHAFAAYIRREVRSGDTVVVVSAPPDTVRLAPLIQRRGARAIYWLQDYHPELVRGLWEYPRPLRAAFSLGWDRYLAHWDHVVKAAGNLGYDGRNAQVIRNWPTIELGAERPVVPSTALYSGNLGHGHDIDSFVEACRALVSSGFSLTVRADGPGAAKLPACIQRAPLLASIEELARSYWEAEVHVVAGHPAINRAVFPSKVWNSIATGRRIVAAGFGPESRAELKLSQTLDAREHVQQWVRLLAAS